MGRLRALTRKEFVQFLRNRAMLVLFVYVIALEIAVCAYAITYDVTHIALAVHDADGSPQSRELVERLGATRYFDPPHSVRDRESIERLLATGRVTMGLAIPERFSARLAEGRPVSVELLLDGSNANTALIALGYARRMIGAFAGEVDLRRLRRAGADPRTLPRVELRPRAWYVPALASRDFVIVAMLVLAVGMMGILHPAAAIAWEKEAGTVEQLMVMPFRTWELMAAKVLPTFVVSLVCLALSLWLPWWFDTPIRGSLALFFALSALFLFSASGIGLVIGAVSGNLQQALLLGFFILFPLFVVSGTLVPVESMPASIQALSYLSPLRYYLDIGLGVFLKGVGLETLWPQALALAGLGAATFTIGLMRFGRQLR